MPTDRQASHRPATSARTHLYEVVREHVEGAHGLARCRVVLDRAQGVGGDREREPRLALVRLIWVQVEQRRDAVVLLLEDLLQHGRGIVHRQHARPVPWRRVVCVRANVDS